MRKPLGRPYRLPRALPLAALGAFTLAAFAACGSTGSTPVGDGVEEGVGRASAALGVGTAPATVAYDFALDGQGFELSLERSPAPTTTDYKAFRLTRERALLPLPPPDLGCSYRGAVAALDGADAASGFAAMNVCASATGRSSGEAASGVIRAGGRFWRLWPDPADGDASDGIDHFAQPLHRAGEEPSAAEPVRHITLRRLPESLAPRLAFREGSDAETKYIDLVVVNDAARVAQLGGNTEATSIQFVDTMNALLDGSGLSPRLRVTLRAQVLFDQDPYTPDVVGDEVDNTSLLNDFLAYAQGEDLPVHDEHLLLSGLDFVGGVVGFAGVGVACTTTSNGAIVQAGDSSGGFAVLSAVHEIGHTLGMDHDDGSNPACPQRGFIMAAVGCGNCPGAEEAQFSPCSIQQFQDFISGPAYTGTHCADDVPLGGVASCGDGVVETGESCDCGAEDCSDIDPCCDGARCQLQSGAECSDFNDGCCQNCAVVSADAAVVCRPQRSVCDIAEVCAGTSKDCPADSFDAAGEPCQDERGNDGACFFGDCRSRGTQCEQIAETQSSTAFDDVGAPGPGCPAACDRVVCGNGPNGCITIGGPTVNDGVPCDNGGQCVDQQCVATIDQCPNDPNKDEPGACGCGKPDVDTDADGDPDCIDRCPADPAKTEPGACGCGKPDVDSDRDDTLDCNDECPSDPLKSEAGDCGCGSPDIDSDSDGSADCIDECPNDAFHTSAGACGCGVAETDTDFDGTPDCVDLCPADPSSIAPPCAPPPGSDSGDSDGGGCALAAPGARSDKAPGVAFTSLGWLTLVALPLWRRRRRG
jgi:reprolysin (M12B) family zinc metalloprotease/disintegrin